MLGIFVLTTACFGALAWRVLGSRLRRLPPVHPAAALPLSFLAMLLVIPARGGIQQIPVNQSSAYFSPLPFANLAALNVGWNFFDSWHRGLDRRHNPYLSMPMDSALALCCHPEGRSAKGRSPVSRHPRRPAQRAADRLGEFHGSGGGAAGRCAGRHPGVRQPRPGRAPLPAHVRGGRPHRKGTCRDSGWFAHDSEWVHPHGSLEITHAADALPRSRFRGICHRVLLWRRAGLRQHQELRPRGQIRPRHRQGRFPPLHLGVQMGRARRSRGGTAARPTLARCPTRSSTSGSPRAATSRSTCRGRCGFPAPTESRGSSIRWPTPITSSASSSRRASREPWWAGTLVVIVADHSKGWSAPTPTRRTSRREAGITSRCCGPGGRSREEGHGPLPARPISRRHARATRHCRAASGTASDGDLFTGRRAHGRTTDSMMASGW